MSNTYKKLSDIDLNASPSTDAAIVITDNGKDGRLPLVALLQALGLINYNITDASQLPEQAQNDFITFFVNPARDKLECHQFRADGQWHRIL